MQDAINRRKPQAEMHVQIRCGVGLGIGIKVHTQDVSVLYRDPRGINNRRGVGSLQGHQALTALAQYSCLLKQTARSS